MSDIIIDFFVIIQKKELTRSCYTVKIINAKQRIML